MKISLKEIKAVSSYGGISFYLPNAVAIFGNGDFAVLDSGNNRVCKFTSSIEEVKSIGNCREGLGDYIFKEPVALSISEEGFVYISDWHNHRVIIFDKWLNYVDEFGHYGNINKNDKRLDFAKAKLGFFYKAAKKGNYLEKHFEENNSVVDQWGYSLRLLYESTVRNIRKYGALGFIKNIILDEEHFMNKPNGVTIFNNQIIVSQKNNRCISIYEKCKPHKLIEHIFSPKAGTIFGRLGNIYSIGQNRLFICDERNSEIWMLNDDFKLIDSLTGNDSGVGAFLPFSCCMITINILCVCGGLNFQFIDIQSKKIVYQSTNIGELHGIEFDRTRKLLYVVDRSNSVIRIYRVEVDN